MAMAIATLAVNGRRRAAVRFGRPPLTVSRSAEGKHVFANNV